MHWPCISFQLVKLEKNLIPKHSYFLNRSCGRFWLSIRPLLSFYGRISEVDFYLHLANRDLCLRFTPRRAASETFSRSERDTSDVPDTERRRRSPLWCLVLWLWALWCGRTEQRGHPPRRHLGLAASAFIWEWCLPSEGMWEKALLATVTFMSRKAVF